jgi:NAD(P)-dependent dehydrogenase (short-subunit alcohol dehydrogenase family)
MSHEFAGQTAIITAKKLHAEGARVAMLDLNEGALQATAKEMGESPSTFAVDITDEAQVSNVIERIGNQFGMLDILVNSAGVTGRTNIKSHEVDPADVRFVLNVNFMGSFLMARAVLPWMLKRNYGRILHIASIAGKEGNAGMLAYSASKAAVVGMTKVQGKEYAETGITINALAPAVIRTSMIDAMPEEQVKYMTDKIPMKRCGTLEEIAHIAAFIVSRGASFTTGFTFDMTGGRATY